VVSSGIRCRTDSEWERKQKDLSNLTDNLVSWDVVNKAPHQVWQSYDGRRIMEKRLATLVKGGSKLKYPTNSQGSTKPDREESPMSNQRDLEAEQN